MINVANVLTRFEQDTTIWSVTRTTVDFQEVVTGSDRSQRCVIQPADKQKLNKDTIDWSLEYLKIHSKQPLVMSEYIEYKNKFYLIVEPANWSDYGYYTVIAQEYKGSLPWI